MEAIQIIPIILQVILGVVLGAIAIETKPSRLVFWAVFPVWLLMWLWGPWVCYAVYVIGRTSYNQIMYIERPPVVVPAPQEVIQVSHPPHGEDQSVEPPCKTPAHPSAGQAKPND